MTQQARRVVAHFNEKAAPVSSSAGACDAAVASIALLGGRPEAALRQTGFLLGANPWGRALPSRVRRRPGPPDQAIEVLLIELVRAQLR